MPSITIPGTARFEMLFQTGSYVSENVFHVKSATGWAVSDLQRVEAKLKTWWDTRLKAQVPSTWSLIKIIGLDRSGTSNTRDEYITGLPLAGTGGGTALPPNVTVAIKWTTGLAGRSYRGRTYHIGVYLTAITNSQQSITTSYQTILQTAYNNLISDIAATSGDQLVIASQYHDKAPRPTGVTTPVTSASVEINLDSQRRRLAGRGRL